MKTTNEYDPMIGINGIEMKMILLGMYKEFCPNLKTLEIFESHYTDLENESGESELNLDVSTENPKAWFFWFSFPGCIPESEPMGPFESEYHALTDATNLYGSDDTGELIGYMESLPDVLIGLIHNQNYSISYNGESESRSVLELIERINSMIDSDQFERLSGILKNQDIPQLMSFLANQDFDFYFNNEGE